eukprot:7477490-Pyramimonas_sp.AAC.1
MQCEHCLDRRLVHRAPPPPARATRATALRETLARLPNRSWEIKRLDHPLNLAVRRMRELAVRTYAQLDAFFTCR